jgi:hypothetical protein
VVPSTTTETGVLSSSTLPRTAQPLSVGARVAVYQETKTTRKRVKKNSFGFTVLPLWEAGIVSKVTSIPKQDKNITNKVQVILDSCGDVSKALTVVWTNDASSKVQRLIPMPDGSEQLELNPCISRTPAPTDLMIGDAVLAWYQKWPGGLCFSGRVAKVDGDTCSVAYDDGDWEDDIPYQQKTPCVVLTRISKGWEQPQWLEGVKLSLVRSRQSRTHAAATVQRCESGGSVWLKFHHQTKEEKNSYLSIATLAMTEAKQRAKSCVSWLDANKSKHTGNVNSPTNASTVPPPFLESSFESTVVDSSFQLSPESLASNGSSFSDEEIVPLNKNKGKRPVEPKTSTKVKNKKAKTNHEQASQPSKGRTSKRACVETKDLQTVSSVKDETLPKSQTSRKRSKTSTVTARNRNVACVAEPDVETAFQWRWPPSYFTLPLALTDDALVPNRFRFSAPLALSVDRSWRSCESETAAAVMNHVQVHNGMKPPVQLQRAMNELILKGPRTGQSNPIFFADCQRMDLACDVVQEVSISWFDFWTQMGSNLYCVEGDDRRTNRYAIQRIATSAHAKSIAVKRFLDAVHMSDSYPCAPETWVTEIRQHPQGARVAFQDAINTFVSLWKLCGHYYLNSKSQLDDVSPDLKVFVQHNSRKLLQGLAKVVSFAGQVYAMEEEQDVKALAYFLSGRVESMLETYVPLQEFCDPWSVEEYKINMKLRMILDLDCLVVPSIRPLLASQMGCAPEYNIIFS